jgi:hypothetical protein
MYSLPPHTVLKQVLKSAARGKLKDKGITYPFKPDKPLIINRFAVTATPLQINLQSADVAFMDSRLPSAGNMTRAAQGFLLDLAVTADPVDLKQLMQALKTHLQSKVPNTTPFPPVKGIIRFEAERFNFDKFTWTPLQADIYLNDGTAAMTLKKALICGISTPGTLTWSPPIQNGRIDLALLVAPKVTLDRIFRHIPLMGGTLSTIDTIPLSAKSTVDKMHIYPLAPSAVGYELKERMKRTVARPLNIIHGGKAPEQN